jgi:hypothetical protein
MRRLRYLAERAFLAMVLVLAGTATLKGYDAVAYVKEGKPIMGKPEIKSSYLGATYLFASAANKAEFDGDLVCESPLRG